MCSRLKYLSVILLVAVALISGCDDNAVSINSITIDNTEIYNAITENVPDVKDMQCTLYKEISIINDEADFRGFYQEYLEKSNIDEQRDKINYGSLSYIMDFIYAYIPHVQFRLDEYIGRGDYYLFEFVTKITDDFNSRSIIYTILINKESRNRIRIWKHNNIEGFGSIGIYIPNYDVWDLQYEEIYDE